MTTAKDAAKTTTKKAAKPSSKGGSRKRAGAPQLVPKKVRKTIDIPGEVSEKIIKSGSNVSDYMRKATYAQMKADGLLSEKRAEELTTWKKK